MWVNNLKQMMNTLSAMNELADVLNSRLSRMLNREL